jgi:hypothetical protein
VVAVPAREGCDLGGVQAGARLGDAEAGVQVTGDDACTMTGCSPKIDRCTALAAFMPPPEAATSSITMEASVMPKP